ncbi:MAG TPA: membrane biogenesis protein [Methylococcaceae bacterium]|nr:membrane biogenesis protein [Methylococcaceae bacterium]
MRKLPKLAYVALIPVGLLGGYLAASAYLLPLWLERKLPALIHNATAFDATLTHVEFNPLSLQIQFAQFALTQHQAPVFAFDALSLQVNVLESFSNKALVVDHITLVKPRVTLNPPTEKASRNDPTFLVNDIVSPFPIIIKQLSLSNGQLNWDNGQLALSPIDFTLTNFQTTQAPPATFHLSATHQSGGTLTSEGHLQFTPLNIEGNINVATLPLEALRAFCPEKGTFTLHGMGEVSVNFRVTTHNNALAFLIEKGHVALDNLAFDAANPPLDKGTIAHFQLDNATFDSTQQTLHIDTSIINQLRYRQHQAQLSLENVTFSDVALHLASSQLQMGSLNWRNLELVDTAQNTLLFTLPQTALKQLHLDMQNKALSIASIQASNADFRAWLNAQGQLNYQTLLPEDTAQVSSEQQAGASTSDAFWGIKINTLDLTNFSATFEDKSLPKPLSISLKPLSLKASNINTDKDATLPFELSTGINNGGSVHIKGNAGLNPLKTQSDIEVSAIGLDKFQSYVDKFAHIDVIKGVFNLDGKLDVAQGQQGELDVKFKGNSGIARLITRDQVQNKDLIKWDNLSLKNIEADLLAQRYMASSLLLEKPYARIIIGKDKTLNFAEMLIPATPEKDEAKNNKTAHNAAPNVHFQLNKIRISNGASSFSDLSMILPFSAEIKGLEGGASGISSDHESTIDITLKGNAYDLAPVDIKGKIQPYIGDYNAALSFKGMPLPLVSAYMAEFSGYKVEKGKMSLGMNYNVKQGELTADNNLFIEQFELGEQIDNPHAIDAPFDLAIALLKDVNGIINLSVPITGSLNDPKFDLGGVVEDALLNVLTKAVSSPFQTIANLLGTDEDLSAIQFSPGQFELADWQKQKLDGIAKVLKERNALKLEIKATAFQTQDWRVLRDAALIDKLKALKADEINRKSERKIRPEYVELDEAETQRLLAQEFKEKFPQLVKRSFLGTLELVQPEMGDFYSVAKETLAQSLPIEQKRLTKLAAARAREIAKYIVQQGGVPNERVFILDTVIDPPRQDEDIDALLFLKVD